MLPWSALMAARQGPQSVPFAGRAGLPGDAAQIVGRNQLLPQPRLHGGVVSPRRQPRGNHGPKERQGGLHGAEDPTGLGEFGAGLSGKPRFDRHLVQRVEVALEPSAHLLGRKRLARHQIDGMIVAA